MLMVWYFHSGAFTYRIIFLKSDSKLGCQRVWGFECVNMQESQSCHVFCSVSLFFPKVCQIKIQLMLKKQSKDSGAASRSLKTPKLYATDGIKSFYCSFQPLCCVNSETILHLQGLMFVDPGQDLQAGAQKFGKNSNFCCNQKCSGSSSTAIFGFFSTLRSCFCLCNIQTEVQPLLVHRDRRSSLAVSTSALALVVQSEHSQGKGLPRETSTPKHAKKNPCELRGKGIVGVT